MQEPAANFEQIGDTVRNYDERLRDVRDGLGLSELSRGALSPIAL